MKISEILEKLNMPRDIYEYYAKTGRLDEEIKVPDLDELREAIKYMKCLSNPIRLALLMLLTRPHCVSVLSKVLSIDKTLVSHHLARLRDCGLVYEEHLSRARIYRVNREKLNEILDKLIKVLEMLKASS